MTELQPQQPLPASGTKPPAKKGGFWRLVWHHPWLSLLVLLVMLVLVFIGQNMEATSIDFLFWEAIVVPKIVLLIVGIPLGAVGWELVRRAFR